MSAHKADRLPGDSAVRSCFVLPALIGWHPVWWTPRSQETTKKAVALGGEVALSEPDKALLRNAAALAVKPNGCKPRLSRTRMSTWRANTPQQLRFARPRSAQRQARAERHNAWPRRIHRRKP